MIFLLALCPLLIYSQEDLPNFSTVNLYIKQEIKNQTFLNSTINYRNLSEGIDFLLKFMQSEDSFYCARVIIWLFNGDYHIFPEGVPEINIPNKNLSFSNWDGDETLSILEQFGGLANVEWNNDNYLNSFSFYNGMGLEFQGIRFVLRNVSENIEEYCLFYNNFTSFSLRRAEIIWNKSTSFYIILFLLSNQQITIEDLTITEK